MNHELIPKNGSMDMKIKYDGSNDWILFARRVQKNPFVKNFLLIKTNYKCCWCEKKIAKEFVVHHKDYDHVCKYKLMKEYPNPTPKRPGKVVKVPDCESCSLTNPHLFESCMNRLFPVHKGCNMNIELIRQ